MTGVSQTITNKLPFALHRERITVVVEKASLYMFVLIAESIEEMNKKLIQLIKSILGILKYRDIRQIRYASITSINLNEFVARHPETKIVNQLPILDLNNHRYSTLEYINRC